MKEEVISEDMLDAGSLLNRCENRGGHHMVPYMSQQLIPLSGTRLANCTLSIFTFGLGHQIN